MKRRVYVQATATFDFEIDDQAESDWDGVKVLDVLRTRRAENVYTETATIEGLLADLGIQLSIENRRISSIDGWADFPDGAASGNPYGVQWDIESVQVGEPNEATP